MKKYFFITLICFISFFYLNLENARAACESGPLPRTGNSLTLTVDAGTPNGGVAKDSVYTWEFNANGKSCNCGQFANGDYWVAPADGETTVTITAINSNGSISVDADPNMESIGLLSGRNNYGNYNVSEDITRSLPKSYNTTTSLVAAIQRDEVTTGGCGTKSIVGECVDSYMVLTVFPTTPNNGGVDMIRPNITGKTKEILTLANFDFSRLPRKSYLTGSTTQGFEEIRKRWSHSTEIFGLYSVNNSKYYSEGGRAFRSHTLIDDYGGGVAVRFNDDLMTLFSDDNSLSEKQAALIAMLTYGLDIYHAIYNTPDGITRYWGTGATQHPGKFLPTVFLASLEKDSSRANTLKTVSQHVNDSLFYGPLELAQVNKGVNSLLWGDTPSYTGVNYLGAYWGNLLGSQCYDGATGTCTISSGSKTQKDPHGYIDGPPNMPGEAYMISSLGLMRSFVAVMRMMPRVNEIVNYPDLITFIDRVNDYGIKTTDDPCVTPDSRENRTTCDAYRNTGCQYYGVTWGPEEPDNPNSACISTPTPPYTKVGRFTKLDGMKIDYNYTSTQVEVNWELIRAESGVTGISPPNSPRGVTFKPPIN